MLIHTRDRACNVVDSSKYAASSGVMMTTSFENIFSHTGYSSPLLIFSYFWSYNEVSGQGNLRNTDWDGADSRIYKQTEWIKDNRRRLNLTKLIKELLFFFNPASLCGSHCSWWFNKWRRIVHLQISFPCWSLKRCVNNKWWFNLHTKRINNYYFHYSFWQWDTIDFATVVFGNNYILENKRKGNR